MPATQRHREQLIQLTKSFIDIPSVSHDEEPFLEHLLSLLPEPWTLAFRGDAVAVLTLPLIEGAPTVVLAGHTDTVPIADNVPATREGDILYGRGASDMKGALAVMVDTAQWLTDQRSMGKVSDVNVALLFFGREELPAQDSALIPAMEQCELLRNADFAILMEPTINHVELGCQGNLNLTVSFGGVAAHSARPWTGSNAVHNAVSGLQKFVLSDPHDVVIDGLLFREVANITAIRGGIARNVIPDNVDCDINIRYAPNRTAAEAEQLWVKAFEQIGGRVEVTSNAAPAPVVRDHPFATRLLQAGAETPMPKQAWTNAADFAAYDVPALNFGPGDPVFAHKDDEQVSGVALEANARILREFLLPGVHA